MQLFSPPAVSHYSLFVDDSGYPVHSFFVDYRHPDDRSPITTLVKRCNEQFAFELCGTICISKPGKYRHHGETLVNDPREGKPTRIIEESEAIIDPNDVKRARIRDDEFNRMAKIAGFDLQQTTTVGPTTRKRTEYLTFDKFGWIYCTSIEPRNLKEQELWEKSFQDNDYNHSSFIRRPFEFSLALGAMVVEQLGPQLDNVKSSVGFADQGSEDIVTKGQMVVHGPVTYVEDPYEVISSASYRSDQIYLPYFIKGIEYRAQQEYRHIILAAKEPSKEDEILKVSPAMAGSTRKHPNQNVIEQADKSFFSETPASKRPDTKGDAYSSLRMAGKFEKPLADLRAKIARQHLDSVFDPQTPVSAKPSIEDQKGRQKFSITDTTSAALHALRRKVSFIIGDVPRIEVAAAAFHSEPCLLEMCEVFENPFDSISIEDQDFIAVSINLESTNITDAKLVFSPAGSIALGVKKPESQTYSVKYSSWLMDANDIIEKLKSWGLRLRDSNFDR